MKNYDIYIETRAKQAIGSIAPYVLNGAFSGAPLELKVQGADWTIYSSRTAHGEEQFQASVSLSQSK